MALRESTLLSQFQELDQQLAKMRGQTTPANTTVIDRFRLDLAAAMFHLRFGSHRPMLIAIVGGTGTGKSTLVNRLLGAEVTATSFRRTFTAGAVAVVKSADALPPHWLNLEPLPAGPQDLPVRGQPDHLAIVAHDSPITSRITLIDTPDLDGDQPLHHAQADRAFRWSQAILFLVTPEKYQMTELVPYYRIAERYGLPALFVMNKAEEAAVVEDYQHVVNRVSGVGVRGSGEDHSPNTKPSHSHDTRNPKPETRFFAIARDGSSYEPQAEMNLESLRSALLAIESPAAADRVQGLAARSADLMDRARDQILQPLRLQRKLADQMCAALHAMESPAAGVDVNPLTRQLQRRLQQRSVLYLMGPGKMLDRVRQVPMLLARLPRTTWDLLRHGRIRTTDEQKLAADWDKTPNFNAALADQFTIVQSRIDDALRSDPAVEKWINDDSANYAEAKMNPADAGAIADEQVADLRDWLEKRWNATPRDTAILKKILKLVPGGEKLTQWSEAAPYLLALVVAAHHALFGPVDLMVVGGFSLATWLTERLSNEVAARTRLTNRRIEEKFAQLAHRQIEAVCGWLNSQAPGEKILDALNERVDRIGESIA